MKISSSNTFSYIDASKCTLKGRYPKPFCHLAISFIVLDKDKDKEPLLIYTAQGSPFRCKKLSVINGSPERNNVLKL